MNTDKSERCIGAHFTTWRISGLATIASLLLLCLAYLIPALGWIVWLAFVPYLLAAAKSGRLRLYALTTLMIALYLFFAFLVNGMLPIVKAYNVAVITLILTIPLVELQLALRRIKQGIWAHALLPFLITGIAFLLFSILDSWPLETLKSTFVIPASRPLFRAISGTKFLFALFFAIVASNMAVADAFSRMPPARACIAAGIAAILGVLTAFAGGPLGDLPFAAPEEEHMDGAALSRMGDDIPSAWPSVRAIVIARGGKIVFERNYRGYTSRSLHAVNSVTKSVTGSLVGIARTRALIDGVDRKVLDFFPEYDPSEFDPRASKLTLYHLLTFTSGLRWNDNTSNPFAGVYSLVDWNKSFFSQPFAHEPGERFNYNSYCSHVLAAVINRTARTRRSEFPDRYLWGPLGIERHVWPADGWGTDTGGWGLFLRTRDMAKLGCLWLNEGEWDGKRVIDAEWIRESSRAHSEGGNPCRVPYGQQFWVNWTGDHPSYFANGFGGQFIFVVPALDLVIAVSADSDVDHDGNRRIVERFVLPAIKE